MNEGQVFSGRSLPWIGTGHSTVIEGAASAAEALHLSGLDWTASLHQSKQIVQEGFGTVVRDIPGIFQTERDTDRKVLGIGMKKGYQIFQPVEAFEFADGLLEFNAGFVAGGEYNDSANMFLVAELPLDFDVKGLEEEAHKLYLLMTNSFNRSGAIGLYLTPVRLQCTNQMSLALRTAVSKFTVKHNRNMQSKLDQAAEILGLASTYLIEYQEVAAKLIETDITTREFENMLREEFPAKGEKAERNELSPTTIKIMENYAMSPTVTPGTAWGALNAVTEFSQHCRDSRKGNRESRFESDLFGTAAASRNRMAQRLLTHAG